MTATADRAAEQEVRDLFRDWLAGASAKDIDAAMAPIADDVLSYEHVTPLQYRGVDAIRPICQQGFDLQKGEFRWSIPDLEVIVRGDIAVTWGLNRMQSKEAGAAATENWSRGTRIFQKIAGRWQMIHQHVSFPLDPATGSVRIDQGPDDA